MATPHDIIWSKKSGDARPDVTVIVPLYNYQAFILNALESVYLQTLPQLDIVIVDDCSSDGSCNLCTEWLQKKSDRFRWARLLRHRKNYGLAFSRNSGINAADTEFIFPLDADNELFPTCLEKHLQALKTTSASFAYCFLEKFGSGLSQNTPCLMGLDPWNPKKLRNENFIDAMSLIRSEVVKKVGGYTTDMPYQGWEDYDLWLKIACENLYGLQICQILARYRVHKQSMLHCVTNRAESQAALKKYLQKKFPKIFSK